MEEYNFIFLMNKCVMLYEHIDIDYQKDILTDIKKFMKKVSELQSQNSFKKKDILSAFNIYLSNTIDEKIMKLINNPSKELIDGINDNCLKICNNVLKKREIEEKYGINQKSENQKSENQKSENQNKEITNISTNITKEKEELKENNEPKIEEKKIKEYLENTEKIIKDGITESIQKNNEATDKHLVEFEKKIDNKMKNIFGDIEHNIKLSLKDYIEHTIQIKNDVDRKNELQLKSINTMVDTKINKILENLFDDEKLNNRITYNVRSELNELFKYIDEIINNVKTSTTNTLETTISKTCNLLINENNNYQLDFDKDNNLMKLFYNNNEISTAKINIKGLMGPRGAQGIQGEKGDTPIIRHIGVTEDNKLKVIVQDTENIYEIISKDILPSGPQGIQGERGLPGKTLVDLNWKQDTVMRMDEENINNLIILKSLSLGEKSHCLKNNSFASGGGLCYNENSMAIGQGSKTLDTNSIAFYGSTIGNNAFSYRAENVDENSVVFGNRNENYNIERVDINSKEINLNCDTLNIKAKNMYISKIRELEEKIINMEKKINDFIKKK